MSKVMKKAIIDELSARCRGLPVFLFCGLNPITSNQNAELRRDLRKKGIALFLVKKSLFLIAMKDAGGIEMPCLEGNLVVAIAEDPVTLSKGITDFRKKKWIEIKGGLIGGRLVTPAEVERYSTLSSKPVLLAQLACCLNAPISSLARAMQEVVGKFVRTLDAVRGAAALAADAAGAGAPAGAEGAAAAAAAGGAEGAGTAAAAPEAPKA